MATQLPKYLESIEFMRLRLTLELQDDIDLSFTELLSLRRELMEAAHSLDDQTGGDFTSALTTRVGDNQEMIKRFQKPSPPLVLEINPEMVGKYTAGDQLHIGVLLPGNAIANAQSLISILIRLGEIGLNKGVGRYELTAIATPRPDGSFVSVWAEGEANNDLPFLVDPFEWWFEEKFVNSVAFEFMTPARLMSQGKPLFRPTFTTIFPFILRRVGSLLATYSFVEIPKVHNILHEAEKIVVTEDCLEWEDWKTFEARTEHRELGGIVGTLTCRGSELNDLLWVLRLGELFNIGKGAAWGSGRYKMKLLE